MVGAAASTWLAGHPDVEMVTPSDLVSAEARARHARHAARLTCQQFPDGLSLTSQQFPDGLSFLASPISSTGDQDSYTHVHIHALIYGTGTRRLAQKTDRHTHTHTHTHTRIHTHACVGKVG